MTGLLVVLGGMIGAPLRYLIDRAFTTGPRLPWGTLTVNTAGSLILAFLATGVASQRINENVMTALGVGLCGALTTYSTFSYQTVRLFQQGARLSAVVNAALNITFGFGSAIAGVLLTMVIWPV